MKIKKELVAEIENEARSREEQKKLHRRYKDVKEETVIIEKHNVIYKIFRLLLRIIFTVIITVLVGIGIAAVAFPAPRAEMLKLWTELLEAIKFLI